MKVKIVQTFDHFPQGAAQERVHEGQRPDVDDATAALWIEKGLAVADDGTPAAPADDHA